MMHVSSDLLTPEQPRWGSSTTVPISGPSQMRSSANGVPRRIELSTPYNPNIRHNPTAQSLPSSPFQERPQWGSLSTVPTPTGDPYQMRTFTDAVPRRIELSTHYKPGLRRNPASLSNFPSPSQQSYNFTSSPEGRAREGAHARRSSYVTSPGSGLLPPNGHFQESHHSHIITISQTAPSMKIGTRTITTPATVLCGTRISVIRTKIPTEA
jgi:hypothetical protein